MASVAIIVAGAIINAAAFTGGNYLAKYLSGDGGQAALNEKIRHDKALEQYQEAYEKRQMKRTELLDWMQYKIVKKIKLNTTSKLPTKHWSSTIRHTIRR